MLNTTLSGTIDILEQLVNKTSNIKSKVEQNSLLSSEYEALQNQLDILSGKLTPSSTEYDTIIVSGYDSVNGTYKRITTTHSNDLETTGFGNEIWKKENSEVYLIYTRLWNRTEENIAVGSWAFTSTSNRNLLDIESGYEQYIYLTLEYIHYENVKIDNINAPWDPIGGRNSDGTLNTATPPPSIGTIYITITLS